MNIASDGGDEAYPAAETGETARTVTIALITRMGKVSAGLQLNGATFRLNLLRCSLERHCQTIFYTACLGVGTRVSSTVLLRNRHRARRDSRLKMAYTYLP